MSRDFVAGTLVRILPEWTLDSDGGIHLVRPSVKFAPARTEAFVAWIGEQFRRQGNAIVGAEVWVLEDVESSLGADVDDVREAAEGQGMNIISQQKWPKQ